MWTPEDKIELFNTVTILVEMQKGFGEKINIKTKLKGWQMILEENYAVKDILKACQVYMLEREDFPAPANLIKIMDNQNAKNSDYHLWDRRVSDFVNKGFWIDSWGNNPTKENKFIPPELLEKHQIALQIEDKSEMVSIESCMNKINKNLTVNGEKNG